ncbi:MAG: 1-acyl-sn-glycerol-3-phosphate acyltransferase [Bacteroidota bacterium]
MSGSFFVLLHRFLVKRPVFFVLLLAGILGTLGFGITRLTIDQEIYSILPEGHNFEALNRMVESRELNNKIFFSVTVSGDDEQLETLTDQLDSSLSTIPQLGGVTVRKEDVEAEVYAYYISRFPYLIDSAYYSRISEKLSADSIKAAVSATYRNLSSPGGGFLKDHLLNDPLGITTSFFLDLEKNYAGSSITVENGLMFSRDGKSLIAYATLKDRSEEAREELYHSLNALQAQWNRTHGSYQLDYFGAFQVYVENALQVKKDTYLTVAVTLGAILLVLGLYYRKAFIPVYFILPALFAALFALGIAGFVNPKLSGLSMATGAVLIGILLNYSFHFFTHLRHAGSIEDTIKELSSPMLVGSLTTVLAFAALMFANSGMLHDFGLLASLSLAGAALFTVALLPAILHFTRFNFKGLKGRFDFTIPSVPGKYQWPVLGVVVVITIVMCFFAGKTEFDNDLNHLSFHKESLKNKEDKFVGVHPDKHSRIFVFASGRTMEEAADLNRRILERVKKQRSAGKVSDFVSTGDFLLSQELMEERAARWNRFWETRRVPAMQLINREATQYGFSADAFRGFEERTQTDPAQFPTPDTLLKKLELSGLIDKDANGQIHLITMLFIPKAQLQEVKNDLLQEEGAVVFDRADLATSLIDSVRSDFNFLLYLSAGMVFLTLLVVYGRIELSLLAFLPMALSWIWILGAAALLGIKFNFVNVVISTFIFGLGDDFSIFMNNGLLSKYRTRSNALSSFKSAIFLSALTTLLGMAALGLAQHPAIRSVALISVLGIVCIVVVSLVVQPIIFNLFAQSRVDKGKAPVTFGELLISLCCFTFFFAGCVLTMLVLILLLPLPLRMERKKIVLSGLLAITMKVQVYMGFHVSKKFIGKENLDFPKPSVIIANHSSFLDILLILMLNPKVVIVVKEWVYTSPLFGPMIRFIGYIYVGDGTNAGVEQARKLIGRGYSIAVFPEGSRSENGSLKRFHKGAFLLAQELGADITPILIHGAAEVLPKGDFLIKKGKLTVKILPRIPVTDLSWGEEYSSRGRNISRYFKAEYALLKKEREQTGYLLNRIFQNYLYKGPVLEWYFRIKWRLEASNFEHYDRLTGDRKRILDIGCGYGYLSYYLHFRDPERQITGLDYDEDKIAVAANGFNIQPSLQFRSGDMLAYDIPESDVIFFNDVLHYVNREQQEQLIVRAIGALSNNGILVIRDGITDSGKHSATEKTELISTKIFGFNRSRGALSFFSSSFIADLAARFGLSYELVSHSQKTSNVLFILRKQPNE